MRCEQQESQSKHATFSRVWSCVSAPWNMTHPGVLEAMPRCVLSQEQADMLTAASDGCPICLVEYSKDDNVVVFPCEGAHNAHWVCMREWLGRASTCPTCRHELPHRICSEDFLHEAMASAREEIARWPAGGNIVQGVPLPDSSAAVVEAPAGSHAQGTPPSLEYLREHHGWPRVSQGARRASLGYMAAAAECLPAFREGATSRAGALESPAQLALALDALGEPYERAALDDVFSKYEHFTGRRQGLDLEGFVRLAMRRDLEYVLSGRSPPPPRRTSRPSEPAASANRSDLQLSDLQLISYRPTRRKRCGLLGLWRRLAA